MARINNLTKYPYDYNITENDFVIGTDGDNKKTKNFPVVALAEYVRSSNNLSYNRIISIGEVTSDNNNITINVSDLGNVIYINEKFYTKNTPDIFTFTPVTEGVKIILLYALPDEQIFYMIEGVESNEAVEPDLPSGALFVQRIIVTVNGIEIIPNAIIISDNKIQITEDTPFANIGQSQKEFNKNISDKLISLTDSIEVTKTELDVLISKNKLEPNRLYKIIEVESWCFSQHLIKAIYLKAISSNTLESEGVGEFYTPKYNNSDSNLGIWKGELFANGMIDSLSYNIGDKVIWGNLFWENISGNIGTNVKEYYNEQHGEYFTPKLQSWLSNDWTLITPNDDESLYNVQFNKINYDIENDYISYREDGFGNKNELSYDVLLDYFPDSSIVYYAPEFIYNINSIALFQWGRNANFNNNISESIVLNSNYNCTSFKDNSILEKSIIAENNFLNISFDRNNITRSSIVTNYLKTYGGIINNDIEDSQVYNNKYYIKISNNTLNYNSQINNNNDNNIIVNNKYTIIKDNILDNSCTINNNTFIEEGKGADYNIKSIYGNKLINNCSINDNTIKNNSKIFGHRLEYYSTINGNTLDIGANIYNNQLIQNCKIDNNILTGHSRIYGNQLDRLSEITNCKLRISPASSYSTAIYTNKLFRGKIQNIDFGNIVNPEGTNPNDPAFGGNGLSECIIENNSIIKDLIFPNVGSFILQIIKMNGFSEFKNITVNDSIRNVDFINTIFNETSDYSKLIEGNGYQTAGFTKTYIDGVLLQDRFDEKQDKLNSDVFGRVIDNELSIKMTPSADDEVVILDSITGDAATVKFSSFGGNVDLSNYYTKTETYSTSEVDDKISDSQVALYQNYFNKTQSDARYKSISYTPTWSEILGKPTTFTPSAHTHTISEVINLQNTLTNKADLVGGLVPASQLPSFVDDVLEFANLASFPATGESGKIYVALNTNKSYRWSGSTYVALDEGIALGETSSTAYRGDRGKIAYDHSQVPHDKTLVGLGNVDNTSDVNKPISIATQNALNLKADKAFNIKVTTPSSWVTGTLSETEVLKIEIPPNTLGISDILKIVFLHISKIGNNATIQIRGKLSESATMPSGTTDQIFQWNTAPTGSKIIGISRNYKIYNGNIEGFPFSENSATDIAANINNTYYSKPFDRSVTNYFYLSLALSNINDQARLEAIQITNN